ncbi:response regulator [Pediococcus argentinicus]|nr:hypothetical protein [Pediococcus argentinicus]NKZ23161.1 hypothetical protein [Pediococcus argentinicus]GEP20353.1 hypothetical protein LSA03_17370 [Pediococcus argentinicus]
MIKGISTYFCLESYECSVKYSNYMQRIYSSLDVSDYLKSYIIRADQILNIKNQKEKLIIVFLGINYIYQNKDGIELAIKLRQSIYNLKIIFVSSQFENLLMGLSCHIEPFDFINANQEDWLIRKKIKSDILLISKNTQKKFQTQNDTFSINTMGKTIILLSNEMDFIETSDKPHRLILHSINKKLSILRNYQLNFTQYKFFNKMPSKFLNKSK